MSTPSLHPEELLDRARRGTLDAEQAELLEAHVRECAACAFEQAADFETELEPDVDDDALVDRAIERALSTKQSPVRRRLGVRTTFVAIAAMLVAAAAIAAALRSRAPEASPTTLPSDPAPAPAPVSSPPVPPARAAPEPAPSAEPPPASSLPTAAPRPPTAAELFAQATRARQAKNDAEAVRLYRELIRRHPDSREAKASRVVLGQLLLDKTAPEQALAEFDGYLERGKTGTVTEEALVGRALALQKLGRHAEERATWRELLAKFPGSVHAARARERLRSTAEK